MFYKIVSSGESDLLAKKVEALEKEGWWLVGGVSVVAERIQVGFDQSGDREFADVLGFHQAMSGIAEVDIAINEGKQDE